VTFFRSKQQLLTTYDETHYEKFFFKCQAFFSMGCITSLIRGGDLAGMLEKRYSGDLSTRSPAVKTSSRPPFLGMATVAHKIFMIRLITLCKDPCRITGVKG
jgi:hypothetical protein